MSSAPLSIPDIKNVIKGQVIAPSDSNYDEMRTVFYGGVDRKPAVIIRAAGVADVQHTIALARQTGLELAVRSGGHSVLGHGVVEGGIVLDLRDLKHLELNLADQTVKVGPGMTAGELTTELAKHDLVLGFGDTGSVGIGGITLGGGIGFLVRKFGMSIDNLLEAEIVTADGQVLTVNDQDHPDLFWAIRGGGGNFGVATAFKFQLHKVPSAYGGILVLPATAEVITNFMAAAEKAPDELSGIANIMTCPPMPFVPAEYHGQVVVLALLMYVGDALTAEKVLAPFRALAPPIADLLKPMRYADIFQPEDTSYHPTAVSMNMFIKSVDTDLAQRMIDALNQSDAPMRVVQLRPLGGAMARVPADATAFAHRQSPIMVNIAAFYQTEADRPQKLEWVMNLAKTLYQGDDAAYIGFISNEGSSYVHQAYPEATWKRLAEIKKRYDPHNLFHLNHNVPPQV